MQSHSPGPRYKKKNYTVLYYSRQESSHVEYKQQRYLQGILSCIRMFPHPTVTSAHGVLCHIYARCVKSVTLYFPLSPLKLLRLIWICFYHRVYFVAGGTVCLTWMSSNRRVRFRSWVGPISFITKLISVMLLHSVYSPSSSIPLLTSTMCKLFTAQGKKYCMLFHQLCLVLFASSVFCSTIPVVWLVLFKRKKKKERTGQGWSWDHCCVWLFYKNNY